jgi:hypothetical protein
MHRSDAFPPTTHIVLPKRNANRYLLVALAFCTLTFAAGVLLGTLTAPQSASEPRISVNAVIVPATNTPRATETPRPIPTATATVAPPLATATPLYDRCDRVAHATPCVVPYPTPNAPTPFPPCAGDVLNTPKAVCIK